MLLTLSGTYGQLLDYVVFGDWIFFGLTAATLLRLSRPRSALRRCIPHAGYPVLPALFVLAAAAVVVSSVLSNPRNAALGTVLIALGLPAYAYFKRTSTRTVRCHETHARRPPVGIHQPLAGQPLPRDTPSPAAR